MMFNKSHYQHGPRMHGNNLDVSINIYYRKFNSGYDSEVAETTSFGPGDDEHFLTAFKTILVATGMDVDKANKLRFIKENNNAS